MSDAVEPNKPTEFWWEAIPLKQNYPLSPSKLSFDKENPRYSDDKGLPHETDADIIQFLDETSDLGELLQSISTSGYVDIEPLIVMGVSEKLIVLEGNRRLAALRVLSGDPAATEAGLSALPMSGDASQTLKSVQVYRVASREDARDFIGFKHINGAHRWDSLAKARFSTDWYKEEQKKPNGLSLQQIAKRMGDRHSTLLRMVHGFFVLDQAIKTGNFSLDDREKGRQFAFSHLYTALTRPGYRQYLGLAELNKDHEPQENPVAQDHLPQLRQIMLWLYGSDSDKVPAIIRSQNPHIKQLGEVLERPKACRIVVESGDLARAYLEVDTPLRQFERRIVEAHGALEESLKKASAFDGRDATLMDLASEIEANASNLVLLMTSKMNSLGEK